MLKCLHLSNFFKSALVTTFHLAKSKALYTIHLDDLSCKIKSSAITDSKLSPIKAAVFPLVKIDKKLVKISKEIYKNLKKYWSVFYDEGGSIGRRYARQDEIGTPFCITIDGDSAKNKDVTIRNRDDTKQIRVKIKDLSDILKKLISNGIKFEKAGRLIN